MINTLLNQLWSTRDFSLEVSYFRAQINSAQLLTQMPLDQLQSGVLQRLFIWWYYKNTKTWRNQSRRKLKQQEEKLEVAHHQPPKDLKVPVEQGQLEDQEQAWPMIRFTWQRTFRNLKRSCWRNIWKRFKMLKLKVKILIEVAIMVLEAWVKTWIQMFL